jgi:hypothetical protein
LSLSILARKQLKFARALNGFLLININKLKEVKLFFCFSGSPQLEKPKLKARHYLQQKTPNIKNRLHKTVNVCIDFYKNLVTTTPNLATIHTIAVSQVLNYLVT